MDIETMATAIAIMKKMPNNAVNSAQTASDAAQTATQKAGEAAQSASAAAESARTLTIDATLTQAGQAADSKAVGDKLNIVVSPNLMGMETGTFYPVNILPGEKFTVSTSDGSVFPSDSVFRVLLFDENFAQTDYFGLANGQSYRTITTNPAKPATKYLKWNKIYDVPLMVNYGNTPETYTPYFSVREDIADINNELELINRNKPRRNLLGKNVNALYPADIPAGTAVTMSTADGNVLAGGISAYFYDAQKNSLGYYTIVTGTSEKTVNMQYSGVKYVAQEKTFGTPLQVEIGSEKTAYQEYDENLSDYAEEIAEKGYFEINSAAQMSNGTRDEYGYHFYDNRLHSRNIFIKAHKGDKVSFSSAQHNVLVAVVANPLGRDSFWSSGWKRSYTGTIEYDGYYVFLATADLDTFNASFKVAPYWIANGTDDDYSDIFDTEMESTVASVRAEQTEPCLTFPVVTDIHRYTASVQTFDKMIANIKHFAEKVRCDFIANLGDMIEGNKEQDVSLGFAHASNADFMSIGLPYFYAQGNHDNNPYISNGAEKFSIEQVFSGFYSPVKGAHFNTAENGTDYYIDFDNLGVRLISLNSCNAKVNSTYAYGTTTAQWLTQALDTQYTVILIEHLSSISSQVWNNNSPVNNSGITSAIQTFVNNGGNIIQLSGHSHVDAVYIIPWLSIMQVCQKFEKADITTEAYQRMTGYIDTIANPDRTAGDYTEDAWSVCVYKPNSNEFDMIRFGAGTDRYFHVTPISPTTLTAKLTGTITWSTSDSSVATVSNGVVTGVGAGKCAIIAKDETGNYECWIVRVE